MPSRTIWDDESIAAAERLLRLVPFVGRLRRAHTGGTRGPSLHRFISELAPRGSPRAYPEQVRELNHKRVSKARFAPYD